MNRSTLPLKPWLSLAVLLVLAACSPAPTPAPSVSSAPVSSSPSAPVAPPTKPEPGIAGAVHFLFGAQAEAKAVSDSPIAGLKQAIVNGEVYYFSPDGSFVIRGDLLEVASKKNRTDEVRQTLRQELLKELDPAEAIVFAPKNPKHVVNVFTDLDCGYCRKLHEQVAQYNAQGFEVRYYPWPRSGTAGDTFERTRAVWCNKDPKKALTDAKQGLPVQPASAQCADPVAKYYAIGQRLGIQGTPALFAPNGAQLGGYVPPEQIQVMWDQTQTNVKN